MTRSKRFLFLILSITVLFTSALFTVFADSDATVLVESGKTMWRYYVTDASGYAKMDKGWYREGYDVSSWKRGVSPFGDRLPGGTDSGWSGNSHAIFLVTTFSLSQVPSDTNLLFRMLYDNTAKIYLNGNLIFE